MERNSCPRSLYLVPKICHISWLLYFNFCSRNLIFSPHINKISLKWISRCLINHMLRKYLRSKHSPARRRLVPSPSLSHLAAICCNAVTSVTVPYNCPNLERVNLRDTTMAELFSELPLEILCEIIKFLRLKDLRTLSLASRLTRSQAIHFIFGHLRYTCDLPPKVRKIHQARKDVKEVIKCCLFKCL